MNATATPEAPVSQKIQCRVCGAETHSIQLHLRDDHAAISLAQYQSAYPDAPVLSALAEARLKAATAAKAKTTEPAMSLSFETGGEPAAKRAFHEVFSLGESAATMGARTKKPIPITVLGSGPFDSMVPDVDADYVFNLDVLKTLVMGIEMNIPTYLWGHAGVGKCLGKDTPVLMFNGAVKAVQNVKAGDLVMGPDSFPRLVVNTTTGREAMYRVIPTKGDSYEVNESHILSLRMSGGSQNNCAIADGTIVNISVRDYLQKSVSFKQAAKGWRTGVDFLQQVTPLKMEPYFLGLWLGDGNSANPIIWSVDDEVEEYLADYAKRLSLEVRHDQSNEISGLAGISICAPGAVKHRHPLREALRHYDLIANKQIPHAFMTASRADRLQVLAGMIDSDGYLSNGCYEVTLKCQKLLDDMVFVARSLGFAATKAQCEKSCTNAPGGPKSGTYFRCVISGGVSEIPCRIDRKIAAPRQQIKNVLNVGIAVEPLGEGDYYGFELIGPDRLFLLGDFTVTHNTTIFEQIAALTNRPMLRVQHTANMEEEHIVGGWRLRDGRTHFELGPLALAMKHGWIYMADEYDFGRPEVTSVYQAVLERKPLLIKEADPENRLIRPHANFRFVATGNTNGQGDESGLYQGTNLQNAANYERFGIVEKMPYMEPALEVRLISQKANVPMRDAEKLVDFATRIRTEFDGAKIGNPISPRSLIYAAQIGLARMDYGAGLKAAFINRLTSVDRETATQVAQRVFGRS